MRRYNYLKHNNLEKLLEDKTTIVALAQRLEIPNQASIKSKDLNDLRSAIDQQIEIYRKTENSFWFGNENNEILAAAIWASMGNSKRWSNFHDVGEGKESKLKGPVAHWLEKNGLHYKYEVPLLTKRVDVIGHFNYKDIKKVVSIELKNDLNQLERGLDQLFTYQEYSNSVYLAITPFVAAEYQSKYSTAKKRHTPGALESKLLKANIGLLLVEGEEVEEYLQPKEQVIPDDKLNFLMEIIRKKTLKES